MIIDSKFRFRAPRGFVVIDGVNGAGKTTLQRRLATFLKDQRRSVLTTREPGSTELGKAIRSIVVEGNYGEPSPLAEMFLFAADRAEHVARVVKPALARKEIVLCDRYFYSTVAFQGHGRGLGAELTYEINRIAVDGLMPDCVLLLDLPPEEGLRRAQSRGNDASDILEKETLDFHSRIRNGFLEIAKTDKAPFVVLDALQSEEEIYSQALHFVNALISKLPKK